MKILISTCAFFVSLSTFADGLNFPATISTNGTGEVELIILADGKNGECLIEVGQDNALIHSHKLVMKPHGALADSLLLKEGKAELFIHCKQSSFVYFNILASTKSQSGWDTKSINKELFKIENNNPANLARSGVFHKIINIVK